MKVEAAWAQARINAIAKQIAPGNEQFKANFTEQLQLHAEWNRLGEEFKARNPDATRRDVRNYLEANHGKPIPRLQIIYQDEWEKELAFQLGSIGMSNPALTSNYRNAPQALTGLNELWIGVGTRMTLNNGHSLMFDGSQVFMLLGGRGLTLQDRAHGQPDLSEVRDIAAFANRLRHYVNDTLPNTGRRGFSNGIVSFPNADAYLRAMGVDPANDFTVNGVRLRLENGDIRRV